VHDYIRCLLLASDAGNAAERLSDPPIRATNLYRSLADRVKTMRLAKFWLWRVGLYRQPFEFFDSKLAIPAQRAHADMFVTSTVPEFTNQEISSSENPLDEQWTIRAFGAGLVPDAFENCILCGCNPIWPWDAVALSCCRILRGLSSIPRPTGQFLCQPRRK